MASVPPRFQTLRVAAKFAVFVALLGAGAVFAYGVWVWAVSDQFWGAGCVAGGLAAMGLGMLLYSQFSLAHKAATSTFRTYDVMLDILDVLRRQSDHTRTIAENSSLSEWAKRVIYREKDYEYLRDTIQAASVRQDWAAAERLIKEVDEEFGLHEEAARLREELVQARKATTEERVAAALQRFEQLCDAQKWDQAQRESERLQELFPSEPRIAGLARELELRRQQYKRKLLKDYDEAVRTHNVDAAHRLLFALDHYLSPNEAAALKESARGVFRAKLQQLGVQFSLAVADKHFRKAVAIGERLVREFPNSRYAQEIISMMPALRQRAAQEVAAREA